MKRRAPPCLQQGYISLLHGTVGLMATRRLYFWSVSFLFQGVFLFFFTKRLDKLILILYNDAVIELSVVQETFGSCFYILFFVYAEQRTSEDHGIPLILPCSVYHDESGERGFS